MINHLGGPLTPDKSANHNNATHAEILVTQARMFRIAKTKVLIEKFEPFDYMNGLLA